MFLNFNKYLFDDNDKLLEEVLYTISYSVFDNYDVNVISFEVDNKKIKQITKKNYHKYHKNKNILESMFFYSIIKHVNELCLRSSAG